MSIMDAQEEPYQQNSASRRLAYHCRRDRSELIVINTKISSKVKDTHIIILSPTWQRKPRQRSESADLTEFRNWNVSSLHVDTWKDVSGNQEMFWGQAPLSHPQRDIQEAVEG